MTEPNEGPIQLQEKITKEDVNRLLDLGGLLKSVLTEDEVKELIKEVQETELDK